MRRRIMASWAVSAVVSCAALGAEPVVDLATFQAQFPSAELDPNRLWLEEAEAADGLGDCNIVLATRALVPRLVLNPGGPRSGLRAMAFSPDGERLYTAGDDKVVQVWGFQFQERSVRRTAPNRAMLVQQLRWEQARGPNGQIYAIAASPTDRLVAIGGFGARVTPFGVGGDIIIYDAARGEVARVLQGHSKPVVAMEFSPSGKRLATATVHGEVFLWDDANQWQRQVLQEAEPGGTPEEAFRPLAFLSEDRLAYAAKDEQPKKWRVAIQDLRDLSQPPRMLAQVHDQAVTAIALDSEHQRFATADISGQGTGNVYLWSNLEDPQPTTLRRGRLALAMDFDPQGRLFLSTALFPYRDGTLQSVVEMWDVQEKALLDQVQTSDKEWTQTCRVSPDGSRLVTYAPYESELRFYLLKDRDGKLIEKPLQKRPLRVHGRGRGMREVAFTDGEGHQLRFRSTLDGEDTPPRGFDPSAMAMIEPETMNGMQWQDSSKADDWSAAISPDGKKVVLQKDSAPWASIDLVRRQGLAQSVAFLREKAGQSPYAVAVGTGVQDGIYVYAIRGQNEACPLLRYFRDHGGAVTSLSASTDGRYLASSSMDQTIKIWSLEGLAAPEGRFAPAKAWGASFVFENDRVVAKDVVEAGTAARVGIRNGDVVVEAQFVPPIMQMLGAGPRDALRAPKTILQGLETTPILDLCMLTLERRGSPLNRKVLLMPAWEPVLTLFFDEENQWAAFTPAGYYESSVAGDELFGWQINRGQTQKPDFYRADQFRRQLERPEVLRELLAAGSIQEALRRADAVPADEDADPLLEAARSTPRITIVSPTDAEVMEKTNVPLVARIQYPDAESADSVAGQAYVNGVPGQVVSDQRNENVRTYQWNADIYDMYNRLRVVAGTQAESPAAFADVHFRLRSLPEVGKPKLHLMMIAAAKYQHVTKLDFPVKDAESIVAVMKERTGDLYEPGEVIELYDENATKERVVQEMDALESKLANARPDDLLVVFLAGHGIAIQGKYYFVPVAAKDVDAIADVGIGWDVMSRLSGLRCKKLVLLDTCHSGNVVPIQTAGAAPLKAAIRPLKQDDILILAATDVGQAALEISSLGHGVFTQAILDGFAGKADVQKDDEIYLQELAKFVELEVPKRTRDLKLQTPRSFPSELMEIISVPMITLR